ncbi:MAG: hypothetical protein IJR26_07475 [Bacteroidales bacterium]|nr:hypothetical protein [Bacteroidales bacterium]
MYYNIQELEAEVGNAKSRYHSSDGSDWVGAVVSLKALSDAYVAENRLEEASECIKGADVIIEQQKRKFKIPLVDLKQKPLTNLYYREISYWANKMRECKDALMDESLQIKYAKTVIALCEFLCLAGQYEVALLQFEDALRTILPQRNERIENHDLVYHVLVLMLKTAICAKEIDNDALSQRYSIMPFFCLSGLFMGKNDDLGIDWHYLTELCRELMSKI